MDKDEEILTLQKRREKRDKKESLSILFQAK